MYYDDPLFALYAAKEAKFLARTDSLCENEIPKKCDCAACPTKELCDWLCEHDPAHRRREYDI